MDVINIISIIVSPIIAVIVGQILQNNSKKRAEKLEIFKTRMVSRGLGWSVESVRALNVIEIEGDSLRAKYSNLDKKFEDN